MICQSQPARRAKLAGSPGGSQVSVITSSHCYIKEHLESSHSAGRKTGLGLTLIMPGCKTACRSSSLSSPLPLIGRSEPREPPPV